MSKDGLQRVLAVVFVVAMGWSRPGGVLAGEADLTIRGTVEYTGARGPVSAARPIVVVATRSRVLDGIPVAVDVVEENGGTFELTMPEAGEYHVAYVLDSNADGVPNVGDPFGLYAERVHAPGDAIAVPVEPALSDLTISFDDTGELDGVTGTLTYTGEMGPIDSTRPLRAQVFRQGDLTERVDREQRIVENGGAYEFVFFDLRLHYMQVFVDLNDDDVLDPGEPFEIYPERSAPPGDPLPEGVASVDFVFGDGPDATPTPSTDLVLAGTVTYTGALGTVSKDNPIAVMAFGRADLDETPVGGAFVSENGASFTIEVPAAGEYYLVAVYDADGDIDVSVGDPYEIYPDLALPPAGALTAPQSGLEVSFDDTNLLPGVRGAAFYAGSNSTVSFISPIRLELYRDQDLGDVLTHDRVLTEEGEAFQYVLTGEEPRYLAGYLDANNDGMREEGEPYTIFERREDAPADPLPRDPGVELAIVLTDLETPTPTPSPTPPRSACVGDCNSDGMVAVNELVIGVNIALEIFTLDSCPSFDSGGSGSVGIDELIQAVGFALDGCPAPAAAGGR